MSWDNSGFQSKTTLLWSQTHISLLYYKKKHKHCSCYLPYLPSQARGGFMGQEFSELNWELETSQFLQRHNIRSLDYTPHCLASCIVPDTAKNRGVSGGLLALINHLVSR